MRNEWQVERKSEDVQSAAKAKLDYHSERLEFWNNKQSEVMDKIKEDGLSVSETLSNMASNVRRGPQVMVRTDYQRDLDECQDKINEHKKSVSDYGSWVKFLEPPRPSVLYLDINDYLFFFGTKA